MTLRLAFFASRNGTAMRSVVRAIEAGKIEAEAACLVTNNKDAKARVFAEGHGMAVLDVPKIPNTPEADAETLGFLETQGVGLILLSGYLRKIGPLVLDRFVPRILNVHPALLPDYGGQGMYGLHVHKAVIDNGEKKSGATVHSVSDGYDEGPIIKQRELAVLEGETPEELAERVMALENQLVVEAIAAISSGEIELS